MKNFDFIAKKKIAFIITAVILLLGIVSFIALRFNLGVDFTGGSKITLQLEDKAENSDVDAIRQIVKDEVGKDNFVSAIRSTSNSKTVIATIKAVESFDNKVRKAIVGLYGYKTEDEKEGLTLEDLSVKNTSGVGTDDEYAYFVFESPQKPDKKAVEEALNALNDRGKVFKSVSEEGNTVTLNYYSTSVEKMLIEKIGEKYPVARQDISTISKNRASAQTKIALIAAAIAIVLMFVYIAVRFKQFASGFSSVLCLFFNLFVMFAFYSVFRWELTLDIIPACLTILGYSINATIVIFDRIRENYGKDKSDFNAASNAGVHSTLLRSVNTTVTTLLTIVMVYILGVESIKAFALPLIIGIVAGLFSSVFLSAPLWSLLRLLRSKKSHKAHTNKSGKAARAV